MSDRRGFALIAALGLAILYFALAELMMIDASRELAEARHFRARIVALTLAENGAELAAAGLVNNPRQSYQANSSDSQGTMSGRMSKNAAAQFDIEGRGVTSGVNPTSTTVRIRGRIVGSNVRIQYATHTQ